MLVLSEQLTDSVILFMLLIQYTEGNHYCGQRIHADCAGIWVTDFWRVLMVSILSPVNLRYWLRSLFFIDLISTRKPSLGA
jgi:hypothetical protein